MRHSAVTTIPIPTTITVSVVNSLPGAMQLIHVYELAHHPQKSILGINRNGPRGRDGQTTEIPARILSRITITL